MSISLLNAASVTGPAVPLGFAGRHVFSVAGTFGGASVGLQVLGPDGSTWINVEDANGPVAISSARAIACDLPAGRCRATVTGGSGVNVFASLDVVSR